MIDFIEPIRYLIPSPLPPPLPFQHLEIILAQNPRELVLSYEPWSVYASSTHSFLVKVVGDTFRFPLMVVLRESFCYRRPRVPARSIHDIAVPVMTTAAPAITTDILTLLARKLLTTSTYFPLAQVPIVWEVPLEAELHEAIATS